MTSRADVLAVARSHLGYTEWPPGSNRTVFGERMGADYQPWCASFVSCVFQDAGAPLPPLDRTHGFVYVPNGVSYARRTGEAIEVGQGSPEPGDICLYCWDGVRSANREVGDHVGIVAEPLDGSGYVTCIEGNTAPDDAGSQDNGGGVWVRSRSLSRVACFWRPNVFQEADLTPEESQNLTQLVAWLNPGQVGPQFRTFFEAIHGLMSGVGDNTARAVAQQIQPVVHSLNSVVGALNTLADRVNDGDTPGLTKEQALGQATPAELIAALTAKLSGQQAA